MREYKTKRIANNSIRCIHSLVPLKKLILFPIVFILLLVLTGASTITDTSRNQFWDSGTFFRTKTTVDNGTLILNESTSGNFTSDIFNVNETVSWDTFAFNTNFTRTYAHYHLNELTGAIAEDSSGNNRDGSLVNMENGDWKNGLLNNALEFDGVNELINLGNIADFERTDNFSIEAWINLTASSFNGIIGKRITGGTARGYEIYVTDGRIQLNVVSDGGASNLFQIKGNSVINNGSWVHVVVTYNGNSSANGAKIYVNSIAETITILTDSLSGTIVNTEDMNIGARSAGSLHFDGIMDEIVFYKRELRPSEIVTRYNLGIGTEAETSNSLDFKVRSCDDASCAGETFIDINDTTPQNLQSYSIPDNQYFQYAVLFSSNDGNFTPELKEVLINYSTITEVPPQAILIKEIFLPNASTSSSTFETVGIAIINLTRQSDIDAVVSFQARREGGSGTDNYTWRFVIDGVPSPINITRSLGMTDIGSVVFSNDRDDLVAGEHNITFQHLSTDGTLFTENIDLVANLHLTENSTKIIHASGDVDTSFSSTSYIEVASGTMSVTEQSTVMIMLTLSAHSSAVNTVEFIIEFNDKNSSTFRRRMEDNVDIGSIGYVWQYDNVSSASISWKLWGRNSESVTTQIQGHLDLDQMTNDGVPTTMSHFANETTRAIDDGVFIQIANLTMPTVRNNSVYVTASFTANIENQGGVQRNVSYYLQSDGVNSQQLSRTLSNVNDVGNLFIQHIFNDSARTHNVSLFVTAQLGAGRILVVNNVSMYAMEVLDFESVIIIPTDEPVITLISPANNTINNTFPINITFIVDDDDINDIICELSNSSQIFDTGTFTRGAVSDITLDTNLSSIHQNFPNLNLTCFDNTILNSSATLLLNLTIDKIQPLIITNLPVNNSIFNKNGVSSIDINAECQDDNIWRFNITITNQTNDIIATYESFTVVGNTITIDEILNIKDLSETNFTVTHTCADTHTKDTIGNYNIRKSDNDSITKLEWTTNSANTIAINYLKEDSGYPVKSYSSQKIDNSKYTFYYAMNETTKSERTYIFEIISRKEVFYISNSNYDAHFITGDNWIDFELEDDATYYVSKNKDGNYEVEVTTMATELNFSSIGDLNVVVAETQFGITFFVPREDEFVLGSCPTDTLPRALMFMFFIILSFIIIVTAFVLKNGLIGTIGSIMLIGMGVYTWYCLTFISILIMLLGTFLMVIFIIRGVEGFK